MKRRMSSASISNIRGVISRRRLQASTSLIKLQTALKPAYTVAGAIARSLAISYTLVKIPALRAIGDEPRL